MRHSIFVVVILVLVSVTVINAEEKTDNKPQKSDKQTLLTTKDKVSYSIGWDIGKNFKRQLIDIDPDSLAKGLKDSLSGATGLLTEAEMQELLKNFQTELQQKQTEAQNKLGEKNKAAGEEFLAKNKNKKGIRTTSSGLQYRVIKEGVGDKPKLSDTVTVHYRGTFIDGTEFDSSYKRGQPATFPVNGVIPGWTEALQLMKVGSKYELFIPPNLAYGDRGAGGVIGPNETLIFTVELLGIEKK